MKKEDEVIVDEMEVDEVDDLEELDDEFEDEDDLTPAKPKKKGKKKSWIRRTLDWGKGVCKKAAPAAAEFGKGLAHGAGVVTALGAGAFGLVMLAGRGCSGNAGPGSNDVKDYYSGPELVPVMDDDPITNEDKTESVESVEVENEIVSEEVTE